MLKGAVAGKFYIKKCGKKHSYCNICKPDRKNPHLSGRIFGFKDKEVRKKSGIIRAERGVFVGNKNPNWKGGSLGYSLVGWKKARLFVLKRDKICRACGKAPRKNRELDVHHIVSRRNGGTDELSNLIGLHHSCHMKVEAGKMEVCPSQV